MATNSCKAAMEDGLEFIPCDPNPPIVSFGLAHVKTEGLLDEGELVSRKVHNFFWPNLADPEQCAAGYVEGVLTPEARQAAEARAVADTRPHGDGAKWIIWRAEPQWQSERDFERQVDHHRLWMRGAFIWEQD